MGYYKEYLYSRRGHGMHTFPFLRLAHRTADKVVTEAVIAAMCPFCAEVFDSKKATKGLCPDCTPISLDFSLSS